MQTPLSPFPVVIAIDDPTRPAPRAADFARRLVAGTTTPLDIVALEPRGDRRADIVDRVGHRDGIVVVDAHGGGLAGDVLFDEDAETVLQEVRAPVLVLGPEATSHEIRGHIVVADASTPLAQPLDVVARWAATFGPEPVAVVVLEAPSSWPGGDVREDAAERLELSDHALEGTVARVPTLEPWSTVCELSVEHDRACLVLTSTRWPGVDHWFSTVRRVVRLARRPVLVVPATS
jgi:hypothetical protein